MHNPQNTLDQKLDLGLIQRWMQSVITHPGGVTTGIASAEARREIAIGPDQAESVITRSRMLSGIDRLEIYAKAYYARLLECIRAEFPVLAQAMGEELFDEFAVGYLERYPSRSYTLNRLGSNFPRYLDETRPPDESWAELIVELAKLELAIAEVFDGPGVEGQPLLTATELAAIPADRWPEARLNPVPCLRLLKLRYPVRAYYTALHDDEEAALPDRLDTYLALTRRNYVVRFHDLTPPEYLVLTALCEGQNVETAIGHLTESPELNLMKLADDLRRWFYEWTVAGFFRSTAFD